MSSGDELVWSSTGRCGLIWQVTSSPATRMDALRRLRMRGRCATNFGVRTLERALVAREGERLQDSLVRTA
jgi:hypothetical protein